MRGDSWELYIILAGGAEIMEDGGEPVTVRAGDSFIFKPGFVGTWRAIKTMRQIWVTKD
ncbi:cupin domain-containing protein [Burkholderia sp. 22PA0106]|uniref:cupin domain-containing protein n=1 Tax=Burkholderia sp. 22PA0106 TaxID=3237371 RepID=UPI0039C42AE8